MTIPLDDDKTPGPKVVQVSDPIITTVEMRGDEPFLWRQRTEEEIADYDKGFDCGQSGGRMTTPRVRLGSADGPKRRSSEIGSPTESVFAGTLERQLPRPEIGQVAYIQRDKAILDH